MCSQIFILTLSLDVVIVLALYSNGKIGILDVVLLLTLIALTYWIRIGTTILQSIRQPHHFFLGDNNFSNVVMLALSGGIFGSIYADILLAKLCVAFAICLLLIKVSRPSLKEVSFRIFQNTGLTA